jgi:hypothetical protein
MLLMMMLTVDINVTEATNKQKKQANNMKKKKIQADTATLFTHYNT